MLKGKIVPGSDGFFADEEGRIVQLRGINVDGGSKFPRSPYFPSHRPLVGDDFDLFFDGDNVSFVDRPWPLDEVETHIRRIKSMGYNSIRYLFTWEAIEHKGPGIYDEDFIDYTIKVLRVIHEIGGIYVYLDPHQDVWSRFSGGDGAPLWTLYAAGFDPKNFEVTESALIQNYYPQDDPDAYPKMIWTTNYKRLVAGTMFALFFNGKELAPRCIINGVNIQDFLQDHFINACSHLISKIMETDAYLFDETVLGIETINEPNCGYMNTPRIDQVPPENNLRIGTCPNFLESVKLGMGIPTEVEEYEITLTGPKKIGSKLVDPKGVKTWLDTDEFDKHYGFQRDESWKLGECIWAQHGVWDIKSGDPLIIDYFGHTDIHYFVNNIFIDFYRKYRGAIRSINNDIFIFIQGPPLEQPPKLIGTDLIDTKTAYCPHYYDGMTILFKTWNTTYNVNTLGIVRNRYALPIFGMVLGEKAIRNSFKKQMKEMKDECAELLGDRVPVIFSETGMPFDMDNKKGYDIGDYSSQTRALDALSFALESSNLSHSLWCYTYENCHKWGDRFNSEDFSFWSVDDKTTEIHDLNNKFIDLTIPSSSEIETTTLVSSKSDTDDKYEMSPFYDNPTRSPHNFRAINAVIRPYALATNGKFIDSFFEIKKIQFTLKIIGSKDTSKATKIYLPYWHFDFDDLKIDLSSGSVDINENSEVIEWHHGAGEQSIVITNVTNSNTSNSIWKPFINCLQCFDL